jgi:hypothetical protein
MRGERPPMARKPRIPVIRARQPSRKRPFLGKFGAEARHSRSKPGIDEGIKNFEGLSVQPQIANVANTPGKLEVQILKRIARKRGDVFLRADFGDMGSYGQVGRALRNLVRKGQLLKIGQGLYARARKSSIDGKPMLPNGLATLKEALRRLGVETVPTRAERAYNSGESVQVPTGRVVAIRGKRVRRRIGHDGFFVSFERAGRPARPPKPPKTKPRDTAPITVREALRLLWEADRYPIRGNEDLRPALALEKEARARAASAIPSPDDPPEFARWLAALRDQSRPEPEREAAMEALYDLFDPEGA